MKNREQEGIKKEGDICSKQELCVFFEPETKSGDNVCPCETWCKDHDMAAFLRRKVK